MNPLRACLFLLFLPALPAHADDVRLEYGRWDYSISGTVDTRGQRIDFERDIGVAVHSKSIFDARWSDIGSRWIPDLAAGYLHIDAGGQRTTTSGGVLGSTTTVTRADADLRDAEVTLRYPWRDYSFTAWGGITVKRLSGNLTTRNQSDTQETREQVSETFPMLHGALEWPLFGDRLALGAAANWISSGSSSALEWRAGADLRVYGPVGITAAWQRRHYKVSTANDRLDATLDGGLLGIYARFR